MEKRYSERIVLQVAMDVYSGQTCLGRFQTRDINQNGAFIETGKTTLSRSGTIGTIALSIVSPGAAVGRIEALVVRKTDEGVGVWFRNYATGFCQYMANVCGDVSGKQRFCQLTTARGALP